MPSLIGTRTVWPPSNQLLFTQKTLMKVAGSQDCLHYNLADIKWTTPVSLCRHNELWARDFYERVVNKAFPSWLSLIENKGEQSNCMCSKINDYCTKPTILCILSLNLWIIFIFKSSRQVIIVYQQKKTDEITNRILRFPIEHKEWLPMIIIYRVSLKRFKTDGTLT